MTAELIQEKDGGVSKTGLALGAASLFLFLVGLKRSFRREDGSEILRDGEPLTPDDTPEPSAEPTRLRNAS